MIAAKSKASAPVPGKLDRGIRKAVERLQACGIETFESCEGGEGHAFQEPTIRFYGTPEAGWRAVAACLAYGLPILALRRVWYVLDSNEPTGPHWEVTFLRHTKVAPASTGSLDQTQGSHLSPVLKTFFKEAAFIHTSERYW